MPTQTASDSDLVTVTPSEAAVALEACIIADQPVCLWGQPGIGKSSVVKQTAEAVSEKLEMEFLCIDVRAILFDPVDLRGLPHVEDGIAKWAIPSWLPREGAGVLFIDELNRAPVMVQNGFFQLVLDRQLGEYVLPEGWRIVVACNREKDGGGVNRMPQGLANRFLHLEVVPNLEDWCRWALGANIDPLVIAFLRFRPEEFCKFSPTDHAFPTPRSWEYVSGLMGKQAKYPEKIEMALVAGSVGHGAAIQFMSFLRMYRNLPNIDAILLDPEKAPVPDDVATLYAVSAALASRATSATLERIAKYLDRMPPEYNVFSMMDAVGRDKSLSSSTTFIKWAVKNAEVVA